MRWRRLVCRGASHSLRHMICWLRHLLLIGTQASRQWWETVALTSTIDSTYGMLSKVSLYSEAKTALFIATSSTLPTGIKKKLLALCRTAKHQVLQLWIESIVRHAYWCPKTSGGDGELCLAKWVSLMNHIVDVHEHQDPIYPVCYHGPISPPREWLSEGKYLNN